MRRQEFQHNTADQVSEYLKGALMLMEQIEPPSDLREVAFGKAVDLLSSKQLFFEQAAPLPLGPLDIRRG